MGSVITRASIPYSFLFTSGSEVSSGATAVKDEGENRIACKECGRLRLECVVVENS